MRILHQEIYSPLQAATAAAAAAATTVTDMMDDGESKFKDSCGHASLSLSICSDESDADDLSSTLPDILQQDNTTPDIAPADTRLLGWMRWLLILVVMGVFAMIGYFAYEYASSKQQDEYETAVRASLIS
jgi:hypothetical protein